MDKMQFHQDEHALFLLRALNEQQINGRQCDVILRSTSTMGLSRHWSDAKEIGQGRGHDYLELGGVCGQVKSDKYQGHGQPQPVHLESDAGQVQGQRQTDSDKVQSNSLALSDHPTVDITPRESYHATGSSGTVQTLTESCSSSSADLIPAHRCVLAANSDYFRALFDCGLADSSTTTVSIPTPSTDTLHRVVRYMYTGDVTLSDDDVEDVLRVADYLGVGRLVELCAVYLGRRLDDECCLKVKVTVDTYSLGRGLSEDVMRYIEPRWAELVRREDIVELSRETLRGLLSAEGSTGYARESDLLSAVCRWAEKKVHDLEADPGKTLSHCSEDIASLKLEAYDLLDCLQLSYIPALTLRSVLSQSPDVVRWLEARRPDKLVEIRAALGALDLRTRDTCDVIFVRSRASKEGDVVRILIYVVESDEWMILAGDVRLDGLESMIYYEDYLYMMVSRLEDMHGYMHKSRAIKQFYRVSVASGVWEELSAPVTVEGECRLFSNVAGLFVMDQRGVIEEYCDVGRGWRTANDAGRCPAHGAGRTLCCLPMTIGRTVYSLRTYSTGYSFDYAQKSFALYVLDPILATWTLLSDVEASELFIETNFHGYSIAPGLITLKDEVGQCRATFDLQTGAWTPRSSDVARPWYVPRTVYGSEHVGCRVYCSGENRALKGVGVVGGNAFWMFDSERGRFKLTAQPGLCPSGLMCRATVGRSVLSVLSR